MLSKRALFLRHLAKTNEAPMALEIARGEGIYLYGPDGKSYIDLISGISVSNLGHNHPKIVKAVQKQAETYMHTLVYGEFILAPQVELAGLLASQLPDSLDSVYFVNSGAEANEGAMKLAKRYTGRPEIVSCHQAYHGTTHGTASLMSDPYFTQAFRPLVPGIRHMRFNHPEDLAVITEKTACVVIEPVQAESGINPPKEDYLKKVRERCDEVGALLVLDEIQMGCGRTGSLFAFEQLGIVPDILTLAKGFGGGMPLGAFVASSELMSSLTKDPVLGHITTFGGHPVSCAAGLASLQVLVEQAEIINSIKNKEALFRELLIHDAIQEVRSAGLVMGVQVKDFDFVLSAIHKCLDKGLITDWFLFNDACIRIAPPLIITEDEIRKACSILLEAIDETHQELGG
jgi:acetylornithine/N-succinyldiaminopimelate aminotransferase